jgi:hypothetical protein
MLSRPAQKVVPNIARLVDSAAKMTEFGVGSRLDLENVYVYVRLE